MKSILLDIETVPADTATLEALMPEEVRNPVMPPELSDPPIPNLVEKCPKYGGDQAKREEWIATARQKWARGVQEAKDKWQQAALDNRARYVENAALHAETGHVKMIGLSVGGERTVYLWETDREKVAIVEKEAVAAKVALFLPFMLEKQMFTRFARDFVAMMEKSIPPIDIGPGGIPNRDRAPKPNARVVTYYGNTFDLPFLARRAAICGEPALLRFLRVHKRGRYLDSTRCVDLHEEWTLGDRETRTGGLDGLARIFGLNAKNGEGATFYKWYQENPAEGLLYLLNDLRLTEQCSERMGVL